MKDIPVGFPLGIKVNAEELINGMDLSSIVQLTEVYHGGKYVIGYDTQYCEKPHYHIHFRAVKETSQNAMKTFRSNVIKKKFPHISRAFRLYAGQDLKDVNPDLWFAYCIKETQVEVSGYSITDDIKIQAKTQLEIKKLKNVHSQKKALEQKEKTEFKTDMFNYVRDSYVEYCKEEELDCDQYGLNKTAIRRLLIKYLVNHDRYGSLKKHYIQAYTLEYLAKNGGFTEKDIEIYLGF